MVIRPIVPDEYARLGMLTLTAYTTLPGNVPDQEYEEELADVRTRAEAPSTEVLVALSDDGELLGGVTFVVDERSPFAEHDVDGRGVDQDARGRRLGATVGRGGGPGPRVHRPGGEGRSHAGRPALDGMDDRRARASTASSASSTTNHSTGTSARGLPPRLPPATLTEVCVDHQRHAGQVSRSAPRNGVVAPGFEPMAEREGRRRRSV